MSKCIIYEAEISTMFQRWRMWRNKQQLSLQEYIYPETKCIFFIQKLLFYPPHPPHLAQKGCSDSCKRGSESQSSVDSQSIIVSEGEIPLRGFYFSFEIGGCNSFLLYDYSKGYNHLILVSPMKNRLSQIEDGKCNKQNFFFS